MQRNGGHLLTAARVLESFHEQHPPRRTVGPGLNLIEIQATAQAFGIPGYRVPPGREHAIDQYGNTAPQHIIDVKRDGARLREGKANRRSRVKRVRVVLIEYIVRRHLLHFAAHQLGRPDNKVPCCGPVAALAGRAPA